MAFAQQVLEQNLSSCVGLIPCAVGGTEISEWQEGEQLFEEMVMHLSGPARCVAGGCLHGDSSNACRLKELRQHAQLLLAAFSEQSYGIR